MVEFILGLVMFPLMLQVTLRLMLCHPAETYSSSVVDFGLAASAAVCAMYSAELAARSSKTRPLTAIHHLLTIAFLITVVVETNELINAVGAALHHGRAGGGAALCGPSHVPLQGRSRARPVVLLFGIATYGVSRVAQLVAHVTLLGAFDLGQFPAATLFWAVGGAGVLHVIQLHTFVIYRSILRKVMPTKGRSARSFRPSKELLFPTGHTQEIDMQEMRDAENVDQLGTNAIANLPRVESINTDLGSSFHSSLSPISSFHRRPSLNGSPNDDSNHGLTSEPRTGLTNVVSGEHVIDMPALREAFETAASQAKSLDVVSNADKLRLTHYTSRRPWVRRPRSTAEARSMSWRRESGRHGRRFGSYNTKKRCEATASWSRACLAHLSRRQQPSRREENPFFLFPPDRPLLLNSLPHSAGGSLQSCTSIPPVCARAGKPAADHQPFAHHHVVHQRAVHQLVALDPGSSVAYPVSGWRRVQGAQHHPGASSAREGVWTAPERDVRLCRRVSVGGAIGLSVAREPYSMGKITDFLEQVRTAGPERLIICSPFLLLFFEAKPQLPAILSLSPPSPFSYPGGSPPRTSQPRRAALSARIVLATRQGRLQSER